MEKFKHKTPINVLEEICNENELDIEYRIYEDLETHPPKFMCTIQVNEFVAAAPGQGKRKATQAAAKAILKKLLSSHGLFCQGFLSNGVIINSQTLDSYFPETSSVSENLSDDPVSALQNLCVKMNLPAPFYGILGETGLPHERVFSTLCRIGEARETGKGKSKKLAKRQAAENMLRRFDFIRIMMGNLLNEGNRVIYQNMRKNGFR